MRLAAAALLAIVIGFAGEARAQRAGAPVAIGRPRIAGSVERPLIEHTLRRHLRHFEYCYERARTSEPTLAGKLRVSFRILPSGRVDARVAGLDNELENCAARVVRR